MKKTLLILVALLLASVSSVWSAESLEDKDIKIEKGNSKDLSTTRPRSLIEVPITCNYNNGFLYFTFLEDLGEVEITVTYYSTGATSVCEYNTAMGSVVVSVPTTSGDYRIQLVTEDGDVYYGEYSL